MIDITIGDVFQHSGGFVTVCSMRIKNGVTMIGYGGIARGKPVKGFLPFKQFLQEMTSTGESKSNIPAGALYCVIGSAGAEYHNVEERDGMGVTYCNLAVPERNVHFHAAPPPGGTPCFRCLQEMDRKRLKGG